CFRPGSDTIELSLETRSVFDYMLVDRSQQVASADTCLFPRPVCLHSVSYEITSVLCPPDAVIRDLKLLLLLEINPAKHPGSRSYQDQQCGCEANLKFPVHGTKRGRGR